MTHDQFMKIRNELNDHCTKLLSTKAREYAPGGQDRLIQFSKAAAIIGCSAPQALGGMLAKHVTSVYDMLNDTNSYNLEKWREKLGDIRNYCDLLWALLQEEKPLECDEKGPYCDEARSFDLGERKF